MSPNILLSTLFSSTFSVREQFSYIYRPSGELDYILISLVLDVEKASCSKHPSNWIWYYLNLYIHPVFIPYFSFQLFELCHVFEECISNVFVAHFHYCYVMSFSCILLTKHEHLRVYSYVSLLLDHFLCEHLIVLLWFSLCIYFFIA
jgi:hypothetical protein